MPLFADPDRSRALEACGAMAAGHEASSYRILGIRLLPWSWGFAVNAVTAWRTRPYITTCRGLRAPWRGIAKHCREFRVARSFHLGSSYLGGGRLR